MGLKMLSEVFSKELSDAAVMAYEHVMQTLTDQEFRKAVNVALEDCRFMPTPAELRELAGKGKTIKPEAAIGAMFDAIVRKVKSWGRYRAFSFDDPVCCAAIRRLGGISRIADCSDEGLRPLRRQFVDTYVDARDHGYAPSEADIIPSCQGNTNNPVLIESQSLAMVKAE